MLILNLKLPLWQAPMAGHQDADLAIAVTQAGGLGALPTATLSPEQLEAELMRLQAAVGNRFNLNFFTHASPKPDEAAQLKWQERLAPHYLAAGLTPNITAGAARQPFNLRLAEIAAPFKPHVVSFHFGLPSPHLVAMVKSWGSLVVSSATTVAEALWLEAHGADAIIAQGLEAGGHRGHFLSADLSEQMGTMALLPQVVQAVQVPVIAAGGIADARGVRAALSLGASAVQLGTVFLLCHESRASALHQAALANVQASHTALTNIFTGRPARGIVNQAMRALDFVCPDAPAFPMAASAIAPLRQHYEAKGSADFSPLWAGQNVSGCRAIGAGELLAQLCPDL